MDSRCYQLVTVAGWSGVEGNQLVTIAGYPPPRPIL